VRSRRDRAQAYTFLIGRVVAGVLLGEPDTSERPNRRPSTGTAIGLLLAVLISAGFAIYGLLRPGGTDAWRTKTDSVIVVKETGARYVMLAGQLRPVLNYASARLALGNGAPLTRVAAASLSNVPIGQPIGIPGAPDALPAPDRLLAGAWTVCVRPAAADPTGAPAAPGRTALLLGGPDTPPLPADEGLLVSTPDSQRHLVWQGRRYRLASAAVAAALGYGGVEPIPVPPAWLNAVPAGPDLGFPRIAGRGDAGPAVGGHIGVVGQVYEARNPVTGAVDRYVLRGDGLTRVGDTVAALILADPASATAYPGGPVRPIAVTPDVVASVGFGDPGTLALGYPPAPPRPRAGGRGELPCTRFTLGAGGETSAATTVAPAAAVPAGADLTAPVAGRQSGAGGATVDEAVIPAGGGVLARNVARPAAAPGTLYLIGEFGVKFPIADADSLAALGYQGVAPVDVPSELLALLPTGPALSRQAAVATQG